MSRCHARLLARCATAAVLAGAALGAQARGHWALDLVLSWPILQTEIGVVLPVSAVSVNFGGVVYRHHAGRWYRPWAGRWIITVPPVGLVLPGEPEPTLARAPVPPAPASRPDPVIETPLGQSAEQLEADRRECNRLATTQPAALADAALFHQSVLACLQERGYQVR
jgi:hypothetical protein